MPAAVGDTTPTTDGENQQVNNQDYKIFNKVATNPYVNSLWNNAVGYYSYAKDKSPIVKYASQTIENNIDYGVKWVAPKVEPVLQSELYKKYEPLLHKADEFGVNQIDKIEKVTEKITETYSQTKQTIEQKVSNITNDIKATTNALVVVSTNTLEEKIVPPVDNYLKSSLLATPLNITLNITEQICDQFLPKTQDSAPTQSSTTSTIQSQSVGPVIRAGRLSRRIQVETFKKLTNLSLRPLEAREAMKYSIDLIQYAATQIDKSTKIANNYARSQVKQVSQVAIEKQQKTKQRISRLTAESINALKTAIETLSKQVPEPVANRAQETLQAIQQRSVAIYGQFESNKEIRAFAVVAKQSVAKLQEVARSLTTFATQQSDALIHNQIAVSVAQTLNGVVDNLTHFGKAPQNSAIEQSSSKEESKAESVTVGQQESDNSFGSSVEEDEEEEEEEVNEEEDHDEDEELNESQDLNQSTEQ